MKINRKYKPIVLTLIYMVHFLAMVGFGLYIAIQYDFWLATGIIISINLPDITEAPDYFDGLFKKITKDETKNKI